MNSGLKNCLCILAAAASITGCAGVEGVFGLAGNTAMVLAAPAQTYQLTLGGMTIPAEQVGESTFPEILRGNIYVTDLGGNEKLTRLFGGKLDQNDTKNVKGALCESLRIAGLLSNDQKAARYQLMTNVTDNRLNGAADITVTTHMEFNLTDAATGEILVKELIATPGTVKFSEHHLYKVRIGKAMEISIRGNFRVLLDRLKRIPNLTAQPSAFG